MVSLLVISTALIEGTNAETSDILKPNVEKPDIPAGPIGKIPPYRQDSVKPARAEYVN